MDPKSFLLSKTVWLNVIAATLVPVASHYGVALDATDVAAILAVVNIVLRFVTKGPVVIA